MRTGGRMADLLQIDDFKPHVGKTFRFTGTRYAIPLDRIISNDNPPLPGAKRRPFILIFRAPKEREYMPDGIYDCEVENGPTYRMYVNPVQTTEPEWQDYQAAFS
jgi:hypothetical protein